LNARGQRRYRFNAGIPVCFIETKRMTSLAPNADRNCNRKIEMTICDDRLFVIRTFESIVMTIRDRCRPEKSGKSGIDKDIERSDRKFHELGKVIAEN
jgi:hypothetical protein